MANENKSTGVGFGGLLFLVFLVLKLCNVIDWSWWWITAPLWGTIALAILFAVSVIAWEIFFDRTK